VNVILNNKTRSENFLVPCISITVMVLLTLSLRIVSVSWKVANIKKKKIESLSFLTISIYGNASTVSIIKTISLEQLIFNSIGM
jgi:hypothetical protein